MLKLLCETNLIQGLKIKNPLKDLIARLSLFADDMAIFLSECNSTNILFELLDRWCLASGARFNKDKTIIIPAGHIEYRWRVIESHSLSNDSNQTIPESIRILNDGESIRYLRAEIGNKISNNDPWPQITENIEKSLKTWEKAFPGIKGCKHIIQMIIGGKTQYITAAQSMPDQYMNILMKRIRSFLWNSEAIPAVATELLSELLSQGSRKILNLKARNEAINIRKIRKILDYSANRPLASDVAMTIIAKTLPKSITEKLLGDDPSQDIFLQSIYY